MKKIFTILCVVSPAALVHAQVHTNDNLWYNNGAAVTIQAGTLVTIQGDITNNQAGQTGITHLDNNGFIWVQGNLYGDNAFKQTGTGTLRLQNKTALYTAPYASENYQVIQGGYRVNGGQATIAGTDDGSFYNLELDNQNGLTFIKTNTDVRNNVNFAPASVTVDGNTIAPNGTINRVLTYDPGTAAAPAAAPANGAAYTAVFGMMNNAAGLGNFINVSTNLAANTTTLDNAYVQGKLRRALNAASGGSYGFPLGLEPSTSATAARGIQYTTLDFTANNYDVLTGYFQQGSDNTVAAPGTVCTLLGGFQYYGSTNHGEWIFTPQTVSTEAYQLTIYPQDYGVTMSTRYFITKDNAVPVPGTQSCGTTANGLNVTGMQGFSEFGFAGGNIIVPVTLKSFTYSASQCQARLKWVTATEQNVKHFEIERSTNGSNWFPEAVVPAAGNSNTEKVYEKEVTLQTGMINYFRLKTVDQDGNISYSQVHRISCNGIQVITAYPNPVKDKVLISGLTSYSEVRLVNDIGQVLTQAMSTGTSMEIPMHELPKGIYLLQVVQDGKTVRSIKLVRE